MENEYMIEKIVNEKNRIIAALTFIMFGVICRILLQGIMMDLFFVIAVVSLLTGLLLGGYYTFIVPISIMIITDLIIGNNIIFLFTWSGFVILAVIGYILKSKKQHLTIKKSPIIIGSGIAGIIIYDIWTNFGSWLGWYPHTFEGFITCYTMAIPFTLWHLITTTIALTAVIIPLSLLNIDQDIKIKPLKKHITIAIPTGLMIAAIISLIV